MSTTQKQESKRQRGKNFTASDDRNICIAWLAMTQDPLKGRDQQGDIFWRDVQEHAKVYQHNWNAVRQRFGYISRSVTKFVEYYDKIVFSHRGVPKSQDDLYNDAVKLYLAETNVRTWKFLDCWDILRNDPKFLALHDTRTGKKGGTGTSSLVENSLVSHLSPREDDTLDFETNTDGYFGDFNSTSEISIAYDADDSFQQPTSWKKAKLFQTQQELERRRVEALETLATAAMQKNELLSEYTKAINAATEAKLITTSGENLDSLSLQILEIKKIKILTDLQEDRK